MPGMLVLILTGFLGLVVSLSGIWIHLIFTSLDYCRHYEFILRKLIKIVSVIMMLSSALMLVFVNDCHSGVDMIGDINMEILILKILGILTIVGGVGICGILLATIILSKTDYKSSKIFPIAIVSILLGCFITLGVYFPKVEDNTSVTIAVTENVVESKVDRPIMNYVVVSASNLDDLEEIVNRQIIDAKYIPFGSVSTMWSDATKTEIFCQAMIRYRD